MLSVKRFTDRFQRWLVPGLLAALVGISAIVAGPCLLIQSPAGRAAPGAGAQLPRFSSRSLLIVASPEPTPVSRESGLEFVWPADGNVSQGMTPKHPTGIDISAPTRHE